MKRFLDASVVVRHLTSAPPEQAERVRLLLHGGDDFWLTETTLLETAYVLERSLQQPREAVVDALLALIREPNIRLHGLQYEKALQAMLYCRPSGRVSFGDALLWAVARQEAGEVYTFDARFPSEGVPLRTP